MKWPALLLPALLLSGCFMPEADCRPYAQADWTDLATYDALVEADVEESGARSGLPYRNAELDAVWHDYELRQVSWSDPLAPTENRERSPDGASIHQVEPGSSRVRLSVTIDARKGEADVRALFDLMTQNVTTSSPSELDGLYRSFSQTREENHILYPDDPEKRQVLNVGYSSEARLPLRLEALDKELSAVHVAETEQVQLGEGVRRLGPWRFGFDLPVRSTEVEVGDADVTLQTDAAGRGNAVARGVGNATAGNDAILIAFGSLGVRPPVFSDPVAYYVEQGSSGDPEAVEFRCGI